MGEGEAVRQTRRVRFLKRLASLAAATPAAAAEKKLFAFFQITRRLSSQRTSSTSIVSQRAPNAQSPVNHSGAITRFARRTSIYCICGNTRMNRNASMRTRFFPFVRYCSGRRRCWLRPEGFAPGGSDKTHGWRENKPSAADTLAENAG